MAIYKSIYKLNVIIYIGEGHIVKEIFFFFLNIRFMFVNKRN